MHYFLLLSNYVQKTEYRKANFTDSIPNQIAKRTKRKQKLYTYTSAAIHTTKAQTLSSIDFTFPWMRSSLSDRVCGATAGVCYQSLSSCHHPHCEMQSQADLAASDWYLLP